MRRMTLLFAVPLFLACGSDDADSAASGGDTTAGTDSATDATETVTATMGGTTPEPTSADATEGPDPDTSGSSSSPEESSTTEVDLAPPTLRILNASFEAGTIDVYFAGDANPIAPTLEHGAAADLGELAPGDYVLEVRLGGSPSDSAPLSSTPLTIGEHTQAVVVAAGTLDDDPAVAFRMIALTDDPEPPAAGTATLRVVHASVDAASLAVDLDGEPAIAAVDRFAASDATGVTVSAGVPFTLVVREGEQVLSQFTMPPLEDGTTAIVTATGLAALLPREADAFSLLSLRDDADTEWTAQAPWVHLLHAHPGHGLVALCVGDEKLAGPVSGIDTTESIAAFQLPTGSHPLTIREDAADCSGAVVHGPQQSGLLESGQQYLAAFGDSTPGDTQIVIAPESFSLDAAPQVAARFVNASNVASAGLGTIDGSFIIDDLFFPVTATGSVSAEASIDSGSQLLAVAPAAGVGSQMIGGETFDLPTGARAWLVLAGDGTLVDGVPQDLHLRVVDTSEHPAPWSVSGRQLQAP